jgi:hypothetical protein
MKISGIQSLQNQDTEYLSYSPRIELEWMDEVPVDSLDDLAGYSQPLLRSQNRLSQELRTSCLPQLWPSMQW